jgi:hypothetical protein
MDTLRSLHAALPHPSVSRPILGEPPAPHAHPAASADAFDLEPRRPIKKAVSPRTTVRALFLGPFPRPAAAAPAAHRVRLPTCVTAGPGPAPYSGMLAHMALGIEGVGNHRERSVEHFARAVAQWFPTADFDEGVPSYYALRTFLFAIQACCDRPQSPAAAAFLKSFTATLQRASTFIVDWALTPEARRFALLTAALQPLQTLSAGGEAVLLPAGYTNPQESHAMALYLWRSGAQEVRCAEINRALDAEAVMRRDADAKIVPRVLQLPLSGLQSPAALDALYAAMCMQLYHLDEGFGREDFDAAMARLCTQAQGTVLEGSELGSEVGAEVSSEGAAEVDPQGASRASRELGAPRRLCLPGQSEQKENTCTVHSLLGVLHLALHAHFNTLSTQATAVQRAEVQALYKQIKQACRQTVLQEAVATWHCSVLRGDFALADALGSALRSCAGYLQARVQQPHKGAQPLLDLLPAGFKTA